VLDGFEVERMERFGLLKGKEGVVALPDDGGNPVAIWISAWVVHDPIAR
jgi:hypothetical protein